MPFVTLSRRDGAAVKSKKATSKLIMEKVASEQMDQTEYHIVAGNAHKLVLDKVRIWQPATL